MKYELPKLSFAYDALEPYIDAKTMEIHHSKHHQAYIDKFNAVHDKYPKLKELRIEDIIKNIDTLNIEPADKTLLKNNGGGVINHSFFWTMLGPKKEIDTFLCNEIVKKFSSIEEFKKVFSQTALNHFGSGWTWLVRNEKGGLEIYSTQNQDTPYSNNHKPLITLDVWEHAYYLKYQNRRAEYIENWWNVLKLI